MHTKLTLRLDSRLIDRAKSVSRRTGKSVSQLVADYFALLETQTESIEETLPPITRSLYGALAGAELDESDFRRHQEEKYR